MPTPQYPMHDSLPERPEEFLPIPLGAGQSPGAYGGSGSFLYSDLYTDAGTTVSLPGEEIIRDGNPITIISRFPERP